MDADGLPLIGPGVDYTKQHSSVLTCPLIPISKVGAIHQKRTLAFINYFIANTVSFLNKFSSSCELRLQKFEVQLQKLEASLSILEAKLSSISGLDSVAIEYQNKTANQPELKLPAAEAINEPLEQKETENQETENEKQPSAPEDPRFAKFFRMIRVGVPVQAVRLKMQAEGLDPSILDNPDAAQQHSPSEENSNGDFSD